MADTRTTLVGRERHLRELQLLVGKQAMELEWLRAELDLLKKRGGPRR